ncbi:MAG: hypothetical protein AB7O43_20520, partial [Hyphomicrobiaceae bacterium]
AAEHGGNGAQHRGGGPRRDQSGQPRSYRSGGEQGKGQRQTVDPDSPFAKLSALKLELEKRVQERSSS